MHRAVVFPLAAVALAALAPACANESAGALDSLPPIKTTSSTSSTTTLVDGRRRFYEVKPGDNIAEIARSFEVPVSEIVTLNNLPDGGQIIQPGQVLEIPDVVLIESLPTTPTTAAP